MAPHRASRRVCPDKPICHHQIDSIWPDSALNAATDTRDLSGVSGFHALRGDHRGTYAMIVTRNCRLTFGFENAEAFDVDFEDTH